MNLAKTMLFLFAMLAAGCGTKPPAPDPLRDVVLAPEKKTVNIPAETLRDCDPIPKLENRAYKQGEVPGAINAIVTVASDCRKRKRDAVRSMTNAFNLSK